MPIRFVNDINLGEKAYVVLYNQDPNYSYSLTKNKPKS